MLRLIPLLLLTSCGILFGLSEEDATNLARYQRNAATYYGGGEFARALDQARRGLEISSRQLRHGLRDCAAAARFAAEWQGLAQNGC